ncbi:hypothetical protein HC928_22595 [bacterium]|nr:hypothetical protein [bacterium]
MVHDITLKTADEEGAALLHRRRFGVASVSLLKQEVTPFMTRALRFVPYGFIGGLLLVVLAIILYPSIIFLRGSLTVDGAFGLSNYAEIFSRSNALTVLRNTMVVAVVTTLGATLLGTLLAWVTERVQVPFGRVWTVLLVVPYLIPPSLARSLGCICWAGRLHQPRLAGAYRHARAAVRNLRRSWHYPGHDLL